MRWMFPRLRWPSQSRSLAKVSSCSSQLRRHGGSKRNPPVSARRSRWRIAATSSPANGSTAGSTYSWRSSLRPAAARQDVPGVGVRTRAGVGRLATARRIKTAGRPRQPLLRQNRRFSSPHPFGRAGLARFEPRRLISTSERRLPGENVCYLRSLGTDEPLTSMNGMARGRATSSLSQNRQNRRNREPTRTGSRSGSCTDPRHRPTSAARSANDPATPATRSGHANDHPRATAHARAVQETGRLSGADGSIVTGTPNSAARVPAAAGGGARAAVRNRIPGLWHRGLPAC